MVAGKVGPGAEDVGSGSWALGSTPGGPPMLPEWLEWSFEDRREKWVLWVLCRSQRWGRVSATLRPNWRVPVTCWRSGDGFWMLMLGRGLLEKEMVVDRIFCGIGCRCLLWRVRSVVRVESEA